MASAIDFGSAVYVARLIPGVIDLTMTAVQSCSSCPSGHTGWVSVDSNDYDGDGCLDSSEDHDDDDDSISIFLILARSQVTFGVSDLFGFLVAVQVHMTMIPTDAMTPTRTPMMTMMASWIQSINAQQVHAIGLKSTINRL